MSTNVMWYKILILRDTSEISQDKAKISQVFAEISGDMAKICSIFK